MLIVKKSESVKASTATDLAFLLFGISPILLKSSSARVAEW